MKKAGLLALPLLWAAGLHAQVVITGTVYDKSLVNALPDVTISNTHGAFARSDSAGRYTIKVSEEDTIFFSYLKQRTIVFPVKEIQDRSSFNISIDVSGPVMLPAFVYHNSYSVDSLLNRRENRASFDYQGGRAINNIRMMPGGQGLMAGAGLDMDIFFNHDVKRSREVMQRWLIEQEQDKYVDHRFNRSVVRKLTGLDSADLLTFMRLYRPSYAFTKSCATDLEFYQYIQSWCKVFLADRKSSPALVQGTDSGYQRSRSADHRSNSDEVN